MNRAFIEEQLPQFISASADKQALEVGCGSGPVCHIIDQQGFTVTGVDISATAIEMAKEISTSLQKQISYYTGDVLDLSFLQKKFDLIFDANFLHCIVLESDRAAALRSIKNALTGDGIFVLSTMCFNDTMTFGKDRPEFLRFDENYILWHKDNTGKIQDVVTVNGQGWCPQRRVYPSEVILQEVRNAGFNILYQEIEKQEETTSPDMLRFVMSTLKHE